MEQLLNKENDMNINNQISAQGTNNKNNIIFFNSEKYFSFGKDNIIENKASPNTSCFNIRESLKKPVDNIMSNNNSFLNKKRKLMTSEELELEQIQREREEVKKMMKKNMALYNRTKSGTTTIVSKVRESIYGNNNYNKINVNNINNNFSINKNNGYAMNFLREKAMNKINELNKKIEENNNKIKKEQQLNNINNSSFNKKNEKVYEIINTNIIPEKTNEIEVQTDKEIEVKHNNEDEDKQDNEIELIKENDQIIKEKEKEIINDKIEEIKDIAKKTPIKESSYLTKIKKLGSMSKLSLCNKIQKYTEICQQVLKEQENGDENIIEEKKKSKGKGRKKKKKNSKK